MDEDPILLPCTGCGYDLRGLEPGGACPECGTAIDRSLSGDALRFADPAWLTVVTRGQRLVSIGIKLIVIGFLLGLLLMFVLATIAVSLDWEVAFVDVIVAILMRGPVLSGLVVACVGAFLVTSSDPRESGREPALSTRAAARWGMVAAIVLYALGHIGEAVGGGSLALASESLVFAGLASFAVGLVAVLFWMSVLAARVPDSGLAERLLNSARFFRWGLPVVLVFGLVDQTGVVASLGIPRGAAAVGLGTLGCVRVIVYIGILIHLVRLTVTMASLSRALRGVPRPEATP